MRQSSPIMVLTMQNQAMTLTVLSSARLLLPLASLLGWGQGGNACDAKSISEPGPETARLSGQHHIILLVWRVQPASAQAWCRPWTLTPEAHPIP